MNVEANTRRLSRCLALCTLAVLALLAHVSSAGAAARPLHTGVSYVYLVDTETPAEAAIAFEHVKEAGATFTLTPLEWGRIVPEQRPPAWNPEDPADPHYQWELYDNWVKHAVAAGLTPVLQVRGAPRWAQRCSFVSIDTPCDVNPADLAAFATAAARRYSGLFGGLPRVRYWQGLNEPNLSLFFLPQFDAAGRAVSAELYRTLINAFSAAVKAVDPSNLVIAGGLGPIAVPKYTVGPMRFTRELLCMRGRKQFKPLPGNCGGGVHFDIYDMHPYTTGSPAHEGGPNDVQLGDLPKLKALLEAADRAGRIQGAFASTPLWVSELSWDSNPPDPGGLPMDILSRWTAEALFVAYRAKVETFMWYSLRDSRDYQDTPSYLEPQSGLFFRGGETVAQDQPKPMLYAYRFPFVAYPRKKKGLFFWGLTPNGRRGKVTIQVRRPHGWRRVATARADRYGIFEGIAASTYGKGRRGYARAHFAGGSSVPFSMKPVPDFRQPPFGAATAAG